MRRKIRTLALILCITVMLTIPLGSLSVFADTDTTPPTVLSVDATGKEVRPGETITVTVRATDDSSIDENESTVSLWWQNEKQGTKKTRTLVSNKSDPDMYTAEFKVTDRWTNGEYRIMNVSIIDKNGNKSETDIYESEDHSIIPDVIFTVVDANSDETPPTVSDIKGESATVASGDNFSLSFTATDENGIDDGYFVLYNTEHPDEDTPEYLKSYFEDKEDNKYISTFNVTDEWPIGEYKIDYLLVTDGYGNIALISRHGDDKDKLPDVTITVKEGSVKPSESPKPSETVKPSESPEPSETVKPSESPEPSETVKPSESPEPSETVKPSESPEPSETVKPSESPEPSETVKPSESPKPSETVKPSNKPSPTESETPDRHSDNCPSKTYTDMQNTESEWFHEGIDYAISHGFMTGIGKNRFGPYQEVTRATIVQTLYAMEGKPSSSMDAGFKDIVSKSWYTEAVNWASSTKLVAGYPDGTFKPNKPVTREELVTILYRYAQMKNRSISSKNNAIEHFSDYDQLHQYAVAPMKWAVSNKIVSGTDKGLEPRGTATRAQLALMLRAVDLL